MNKSAKVIIVMGLMAMLALLLMSLCAVEGIPQLRELADLSQQIRSRFHLDQVFIARTRTQAGFRYRATFEVEGLTQQDIATTQEQIGHYIWNNPGRYQIPAEVWVVYQKQQGWACTRRIHKVEKQIMPPAIPSIPFKNRTPYTKK